MAKKTGKAGRPVSAKYKPAFAKALVAFYDRDVFDEDGKLNPLPTMVDFIDTLDVPYGTFMSWLGSDNADKYAELHAARAKAQAYYERNLSESARQGKANPAFSIFMAKNKLGWKDKQDIDLNVKGTWASLAKSASSRK